MAKRSSLGSMMRKKLTDITNLQTAKAISKDENPPEDCPTDKDYIDQLMRERMTLMRLVSERNKIVELSGAELQKLRISLQKLQQQNLNLAQSNSRMLAELNLGREKVKTLQHELLCKDALLKAKNLEIEVSPYLALYIIRNAIEILTFKFSGTKTNTNFLHCVHYISAGTVTASFPAVYLYILEFLWITNGNVLI
ncbi:SHUGOSHIN 1-like [Prunus dulcis]|uniref:SHUGOSHIN 1-like n=1 Tax=Prunus dulcis TaxID=3755 RepID=UPI0014835AEF|nr:SHUGOSHIN 1-like [Prunus dulcis]